MARRRQAEAREPALEGAAVHPGARRHLLDGLQVGRSAQHFLHHPPQLARQGREHGGQLVQQLARGGARLFERQYLAQPGGVVVQPVEHDRLDAGMAEGEQHRRGGGGEGRVHDQRERGKQHAQPRDLVGAGGETLELRVHGGQLHRAGADGGQGLIPVAGEHHREPWGGRPAQLMELDGGDSG